MTSSLHRGTSVAVFMLCMTLLFAQQPTWLKHYGNGGFNSSFRIDWDHATHLYGLGLSIGGDPVTFDGDTYTALGHQDILLLKYDTSGTVQWVRSAGSTCFKDDNELVDDIAVDHFAQRVLITGEFNCSTITFGAHVINATYSLNPDKGFVASYDSAGNCLWAQGILGFDVRPEKILVDQASNVFLFGTSLVSNATFQGEVPISVSPGGFVGKYSTDGELLSAERLLTDGKIYGATWSSPTEWIVGGEGESTSQIGSQPTGAQLPGSDGWIARMDTNGTVSSVTSFRSNNWASIREVRATLSGETVFLGFFKDSLTTQLGTITGPTGSFTYFIGGANEQGVIQWLQPVRSDVLVGVADLELGPDGDIYVYGKFQGDIQLPGTTLTANTSLDSFFARFDATNGTCKAAYHFGRSNFGSGSLVPTANGIYISGEFDSTLVLGSFLVEPNSIGVPDFLLAKFDSLSGFTGVQHRPVFNEELHIFANPSNGVCTIELPQSLRFTNELVLSVFDNTGQLVQRIPLTAGSEGIKLDIRAQAKGIYHVELGDGEQRYSGSIVFE